MPTPTRLHSVCRPGFPCTCSAWSPSKRPCASRSAASPAARAAHSTHPNIIHGAHATRERGPPVTRRSHAHTPLSVVRAPARKPTNLTHNSLVANSRTQGHPENHDPAPYRPHRTNQARRAPPVSTCPARSRWFAPPDRERCVSAHPGSLRFYHPPPLPPRTPKLDSVALLHRTITAAPPQ